VRAQRVHDLIAPFAAESAQSLAVIAADAVLTFGELDRCSAALAGWLDAYTDPGDRVAVVADNSAAYAVLYYGAARSGRVLALINQRLSAAEQYEQITTSTASMVFGDPGYLAELSGRPAVVFGTPDWGRALGHAAYTGAEPAADDPAWLVFTTGSTGAPKGALHTHRSLTAGVWGTVEGRSVPPADVYLFPFPMCHVAGYNVLVRHATGSTVVLAERFRAAEFVDTVNAHRVATCSLAPTMLHALLAHVDATGASMPSLREIAYGSSAISADLIERATAVLDVDFHQGYGMTETAGNVTFLGPGDHRAGGDLLGSAGMPHSGVEVAIVDSGGGRTPVGGTGEVVVRGPQLMARYWQDPGATAAALTDGWLHTGDIGRLDAAGRLWIVDRAKDVIITGGENVSSREVEDALSTHPDVDMVAVVGVPDEYWGEAICAVVVVRPGAAPSPQDLIGHVRESISAFKRPRHVVFVDALPMTSNGKIAKGRVREQARDATLGTWPRSRH
jgi:acyl-CoA synthetase (AMP-forming)/AMP-acid ligase II